MSKADRPLPPPVPHREHGYQPLPAATARKPAVHGGYRPKSSRDAPARPPSNPPNQGTSGRK